MRVVIWPLCLGFALLGCADRSPDLPQTTSTIRLAIIGQALIEHDPRQYLDAPLSTVAPILSEADAVFTNLEVAVAGNQCACERTRDDVYFHGSGPEVLDYLRDLGVSLMSLANNHAWDYGPEGILSTIAEADARGFAHSGTGDDASAATAPAYLQIEGITLALVSAASVNSPEGARATDQVPGVNMLDPNDSADWERNLASIRLADESSDIVLVYQHYQTDAPSGWQESWARTAIDAGADIYVSHGEPTLAGVEIYNNGLILYGLGNFIFHTRTEPGRYTSDVWESVVAEVELSATGIRDVIFTPIALDPGTPGPLFFETRGYPEVPEDDVGESILYRLAELSASYGTSIEVEGSVATLQVRSER